MGASNQPLVYPWNPCMVYPETGCFPCKNRNLLGGTAMHIRAWWKRCPKHHWVGRRHQVPVPQENHFQIHGNGLPTKKFQVTSDWTDHAVKDCESIQRKSVNAPACLWATDHSRVYSIHFHFGMQTCFSWVVSPQGFTIIVGPVNKDPPEIFHLPQPIKQSVTVPSAQRTLFHQSSPKWPRRQKLRPPQGAGRSYGYGDDGAKTAVKYSNCRRA